MSAIVTRAHQIGIDSTATNNFTIATPVVPDGTLTIARGNAGATTTDVLKIDANNNAYFPGTVGSKTTAPVNGFRLSLLSGNSAPEVDVTGASTLYLVPHCGNTISLYDPVSSSWVNYSSAQISSPLGALGIASTPLDIFIFANANGTLGFSSLQWQSSGTDRQSNSLTMIDGVWVRTGQTNRRYVGTIKLTSTNQAEDSGFRRLLWNYNNRVRRSLKKRDSTTSWSYTSATPRVTRGTTTNYVEVLTGMAEEAINLSATSIFSNTSIAQASTGIHLDSVSGSANLLDGVGGTATCAASGITVITNTLNDPALLGWRWYIWGEQSQAVGTTTWYGRYTGTSGMPTNAGLSGSVVC